MFGLVGRSLSFVFHAGVLGANVATAAFSRASVKTKLLLSAGAIMATGAILTNLERTNDLPPAEPTRGHNINPGEVAPPGERVIVTPDVYGNITLPGSIIAKVYLESIFDVQVNNRLNGFTDAETGRIYPPMAEGPEKEALRAWAAETRAILMDAITKFEDIPLDGAARQAVAEIQRQQIEGSRIGHEDRDEDYHQGMVSPAAVLELRERADLFIAQYPEYKVTADQARALDALWGVPEGSAADVDIITALTTLPPAGDMGIYTYSRYRVMVIEAAARHVVVGEQHGALETPAADDHAAVTPRTQSPATPKFG